MILPEKECRVLLEKIVSENQDKTIAVSIAGTETGSTRFANNAITTNGVYNQLDFSVEIIKGKKLGVAVINELGLEKIREAVKRAETLAALAPENEELMPPLGPQDYLKTPPRYFPITAECAPARRAEAILATVEKAKQSGLSAAGFFETVSQFSSRLNSRGLSYYVASSRGYYSNTMRGEGCSGWAAGEVEDLAQLNIGGLADYALNKALASRKPRRVEPGKYTVILEPAAVADLVAFLGYNLAAREADEGRSFLSKGEGANRLGEQLFAPSVTIYSDPASPLLPASTVGEDGLSLQKTVWVDRGVVKNLIYTRYWAEKMKRPVTSFPSNLLMMGGSGSLEDLIRSTEKGILVSRFWYIRDLNPMIMLLTGLTRDGVFWIEQGKISHPINNFRFNESPGNVLKNVVAMSVPVRAVGGETGQSAIVPALKVKDFNFSSISEAV
jgi:predicted Zn-dependent protease